MAEKNTRNEIVGLILAIGLSVSLSVSIYAAMQSLSRPDHKDTVYTYYAYSLGWDNYKKLPQEWRPRLFSMWTAALFFSVTTVNHQHIFDAGQFSRAVGRWAAFWLMGTNLLFLIFFRKRAAWMMLVTYAVVLTAYSAFGMEHGHRPWDMPILFFATLAVGLAVRGKTPWFLLVLPLATGFKESALVFALLIFADADLSLKKKAVLFLATVSLCIAVKWSIDVLTVNPAKLMSMTTSDSFIGGEQRWLWNLKYVLQTNPLLPLTINLTLIAAFLVMAPNTVFGLWLKLTALAIAAGLMLFGMINELRIWFEILPLCLAGFYLRQFPEAAPVISPNPWGR